MQRHLLIYVRSELFRDETFPPSTSRRFYPKKKDIVILIYIAAMKARFSTLDQENLAMKIQVWEKQYPSDKSSLDDMEDMTNQE